MTADGDRGWEGSWEESWKESWGDATYEDDEAQDNAGEDWVEPPVLCAKAALEILAEFLDCSPNAARKRFKCMEEAVEQGNAKAPIGTRTNRTLDQVRKAHMRDDGPTPHPRDDGQRPRRGES